MDLNNNPNFDVISTEGLPLEKWLELRRQGIGGSDLAGIMGMNSYVSPVDIYLDKTWQTPIKTEETPVMRRGHILEPIVAQEYSLKYPSEKIITPPGMLRSKKHPFMQASLDKIIIIDEMPGVLEFKTVGGFVKDQWGCDGGDEEDIPERVFCQAVHYMVVSGFTYAIVVALFVDSWELRRYFFYRDETVIKNVIDIEEKFWNENVLPREPPLPTNSQDCNKLWMYDKGTTVTADDDIVEIAFELRSVKEATMQLIGSGGKGGKKSELEAKIKSYMGDNQVLLGPSGSKLCSWKTQTARRFQTGEFAKDHPELDAEYRKESTSRVFRLGKGL